MFWVLSLEGCRACKVSEVSKSVLVLVQVGDISTVQNVVDGLANDSRYAKQHRSRAFCKVERAC